MITHPPKFLLVFIFTIVAITAQAQPVSLRPDITVDSLCAIQPYAVRIEYDSLTASLYYHTFGGNIYQVIQSFPVHDSLIATTTDHGINYMQGFLIKDSMMFVCGNHKTPGAAGYGVIACGVLQPDGSRLWHNVLTTTTYPSSATLYDHAFSAIILTPAGDSLIFTSGSRTDHGEVQTTGGLYPGIREVPLTSKIFIIPANAVNLFLPDDEQALDSMGVVYARGVRNTFDLSFDTSGNLFGTENSGDRDDPEELNWIRRGHHYGFPWEMGGNQTPMQFAGYNATLDLMINHNSLAWGNNYFFNDSLYPTQPAGLTIAQPVKNLGPDADKYRNPLTGAVEDASENATFITSFTSHRSPLGLTFDAKNKLGSNYTGDGFVLSYTKGTLDSTGTLPGNTTGPFADLSEDLLQLHLTYNAADDNYIMTAQKIVEGFKSPVDALLVNNIMYVVELGLPPDPSVIRIVAFPDNQTGIGNNIDDNITAYAYPIPVKNQLSVMVSSQQHKIFTVDIMNATGQVVFSENFTAKETSVYPINFSTFAAGLYLCRVSTANGSSKIFKVVH